MGELKPGWKTVKFGEVVRQVKEKADPETSGLERFVAGEHMDTDDLRIRRWGDIGAGYLGPAFHARFRPGQVLYGSRRTYLRKVAVADFDGICANTTFVLEPRDSEVLLPELLPFIMQADAFHEHSKRESKGSVNPYVNFSDLAWYEFALPPLAEQRRLVRVFEAGRAVVDACEEVLTNARATRLAYALQVFAQTSGATATIGAHIEESTYGPRFDGGLYDADGAVAQLRTTDIDDDGNINYLTIPCVKAEPKALKAHLLRVGDVVISRSGTCGLTAVFEGHSRPTVAAAFLVRLRTRATLRPRYLHEYLSSPLGRSLSLSLARGGVQKNINASELLDQKMIVPPLPAQDEVTSTLEAARSAEGQAKLRHMGARRLAQETLNAVLNSGESA